MNQVKLSENKPKNRTVAELVEEITALTTEIQQLYCLDAIPWVIGYSGGKDSTATLQLVWNAIAALPPEQRTKTIYVITTDTLVENPIVSAWVRNSLKQIKLAAEAQGLPFEPHLLQPEVKETYWVSLIGKGYPAPRGKFRWCTERLKIKPSNRFIRNVIRSSGEAIVVLGTRKAESQQRARRMKKMEAKRVRDRLTPNMNLPNSLVYSPIEDWQNDEVWLYLMQWENPWEYSNKDLFAMYRGASADNECPLVVDTSTPSCGSSRFGCWVCTLVSQDKSLTAMIDNDEEKEWLEPLLDLRKELEPGENRERRDFRRSNGNVQLYERNLDGQISVEPIPGPYTKEAREYWLRRLLTVETEIRQNCPDNMGDITLISQEELSEIRRIWLEEKHEFDDSLPRIYEEVTGEPFKDIRPGAENHLLGVDEWQVLEEICDNDAMHLELMAKLLDTERQYVTRSRRIGIYEALERCFDTSSRSKEDAIANAHLKRDLKTAADEGDVDTVKQLAWANLKFPVQNS
ncbi:MULTISPECIES: DNA phosphorothioation system sulfurtransferase DndC [unclassified Moorena]|uniref:DNA phosphorothioation system sulfurtransferase DndC n=1 Tax=unclassified Moorena TaxID=2683338 RepID=UPI0013CC3D38|nr:MULTISPECIES: DNA phosphorothioation system sulfurtransferase DndC [unclassified Moorena]NEO19111.1 DNA phosphorothioation system sulfurtransferase DndC [Moorena sp. SIO4A5]NEP20769.1 DNA phosphorothioation system sulfurtransferase DndC [Moorena sp. SIO3I6]NEQ57111.1 DNA phosphorothioation system sulfurtransferase DndC [Moorena sp. SIO4A1]